MLLYFYFTMFHVKQATILILHSRNAAMKLQQKMRLLVVTSGHPDRKMHKETLRRQKKLLQVSHSVEPVKRMVFRTATTALAMDLLMIANAPSILLNTLSFLATLFENLVLVLLLCLKTSLTMMIFHNTRGMFQAKTTKMMLQEAILLAQNKFAIVLMTPLKPSPFL